MQSADFEIESYRSIGSERVDCILDDDGLVEFEQLADIHLQARQIEQADVGLLLQNVHAANQAILHSSTTRMSCSPNVFQIHSCLSEFVLCEGH